jgi:hypothetical protein
MKLDRKGLANFFDTVNLISVVTFVASVCFGGATIGYDWMTGQWHSFSFYARFVGSLCLLWTFLILVSAVVGGRLRPR